MVMHDLTQYQRKRFCQQLHKCSYCGDYITNTEPLTLIKEHIGKQIRYIFLHERCYYGKEEQQNKEKSE